MMEHELLKLVAMHMYFRLDREHAIRKRWKRHNSIASIECIALDVILDNMDTIKIIEKMR